LQPVTITINQRVVSGHAGMTILEIARESKIDIPTLCDDSSLEPVGACRLCLVENEQSGALLASCVTAVSPGMIINTNSPRVLEHRKTIVKLLLASHPDACLVCDKGNRCRLRQIASTMNIGFNELEKIPQFAAIQELNPFITRDMAKCVLCGKCVRACREIVVEGAIDYYQRGFSAHPATLNDTPLERSPCTFCGACLALCPTGALMEKEVPFQGTTGSSVRTACAYCGCGCPITLEIKGRRVVRALPTKGDFFSNGALCIRGGFGYDYIHSKERLVAPLIKEGDHFKKVSWEVALKAASAGLNRVKSQFGPDAMAVFGSSKCTNEENYLLQRFARTVLKTNNIDNGSSPYNLAIRSGLGDTTGYLSTTNLLEALEEAELILVIGTDLTVTAPRAAYAVKRAVRNKQAKLILIEPRQTKLASFAHWWLRPEPGSEALLLNGMASVIIEEKLFNAEYVSRLTEGFSALADALKSFSLEAAAKDTHLPADEILSAARAYAGASKSAIVLGPGITCAASGIESIKALSNLALLTDNIWCSSCGIYSIQKDNNGMGACEIGSLPDFLPGYQPVADLTARNKFERLWQSELPANPGLSMAEALSRGKEIPLKALYVVGENPVLSLPQPRQTREALSSLDFLVVQDLFLTETAAFADVVFPAASFAEKEGSFTNFEGRINWLKQAIPPYGESLPDWEIVLRLAKEMGDQLPYSTLEQVITEIEEFVPLYEGYDHQEERPSEKWSHWEERRNLAFQSLAGFPRFSIPDCFSPPHKKPEEYPFCLVLEETLPFFGNGTRSGKARRLKTIYPPLLLKIGTDDAAKLALATGNAVRISSPFSQLNATVDICATLPPGMIALPASFPDAMDLFSPDMGKEKNLPPASFCYAQLERVSLDE